MIDQFRLMLEEFPEIANRYVRNGLARLVGTRVTCRPQVDILKETHIVRIIEVRIIYCEPI